MKKERFSHGIDAHGRPLSELTLPEMKAKSSAPNCKRVDKSGAHGVRKCRKIICLSAYFFLSVFLSADQLRAWVSAQTGFSCATRLSPAVLSSGFVFSSIDVQIKTDLCRQDHAGRSAGVIVSRRIPRTAVFRWAPADARSFETQSPNFWRSSCGKNTGSPKTTHLKNFIYESSPYWKMFRG